MEIVYSPKAIKQLSKIHPKDKLKVKKKILMIVTVDYRGNVYR